jgi:formylglycine-generating enzyme required for sulfatase activity
MKRLYLLMQLFICSIMLLAQTDVDTRIAVNDQQDPDMFVLIISNENYKYEQPVPFALNDGATFKLYCEKTLGVPTKNIRYTPDATLNEMRRQLLWLDNVMKAYQGEARAIVYYSGHGMPSEDAKHAYLLPVDGDSRLAESGLSTEQLYKQLSLMPSKGTIVLLDTCFSGARRDGQMLASNRGVAIKVKEETISGNMVVFSAAHGDETAYPYEEKKHGLFTYFLLSALQESGGCISLGKLSDQVTKMVSRRSIVENDKGQTPTVRSSSTSSGWRNWMFANSAAKRYETLASTTNAVTQKQTEKAKLQPAPVDRKARSEQTATTNTQQLVQKDTPSNATISGESRKVITVGNVSFTMIRVDGGTFTMGATSEQGSDAYGDEKPAHQVTLSPYYIGETEVTQALWEAVMGSNPSYFNGARRPVEEVSWDDCQDFIRKLNQKTGQNFRLPTEAEWEYAARGGNKSRGFKYAGSNTIGDVAWYTDNSGSTTHDVKTKQANELGLYDMSGNVWEWCQDWKGGYSSSAQTNPTGPSSGSGRVSRGGSWDSLAWGCRVSYRNGGTPDVRLSDLGLRLALQ